VNFTLSGSATKWNDYVRYEGDLPEAITFPAGAATATFTLHGIDDNEVEGDETIILTLVADSSYQTGSSAQATVTIRDDDSVVPPSPPTITVTAVDAQASEEGPDPATFEFTRTGDTSNALIVRYNLRGTATKWNDYRRWEGDMPTSITIPAGESSTLLTIYPFDDAEIEGDETVVLTLAANESYVVGPTNRATVTITDNDSAGTLPTVTVLATDGTASLSGPDPGTFTLTRNGDTSSPLTVNFALGGSATKWNDYRRWEGDMPESITISAGATSADLTIYPVGEPGGGSALDVVLTIGADAGYTVGAPASASVNITATALPKITAISRDTNGAQLAWEGRPGQAYRVAYKNSLTDAGWTDISGDISATESTVSWSDSTAGEASQRFYLVYEVN
jgi:hypothetical protein